MMPPAKRKPATATTTPPAGNKAARLSKLAKENNITAQEETEIKEAWSLFTVDNDGVEEEDVDVDASGKAKKGKARMKKEEESVMRTEDVRRALTALNIPPTPHELREYVAILDPEACGSTTYPHFLAICALKFRSREQTSDAHTEEVDEAWNLFCSHSTGATQDKITMAGLKKIAKLLRDDVPEELLRDMLLEANGGAGVGAGVSRDDFESVMRRAGVWR